MTGISTSPGAGVCVCGEAGQPAVRDGGVWSDLPDHVDKDRIFWPGNVVCGREARGHCCFMPVHQHLRGCDPGLVITLTCVPDARAIDWRGRMERGGRARPDDRVQAVGKSLDIANHCECVRDPTERVVEHDVTFGEFSIRLDCRHPHRAVRLVERRGIDPRRRLYAAAIRLAAHELMKINPEVVLKDEHALARLRMHAEAARERERNEDSLHSLSIVWSGWTGRRGALAPPGAAALSDRSVRTLRHSEVVPRQLPPRRQAPYQHWPDCAAHVIGADKRRYRKRAVINRHALGNERDLQE